MENLPDIPFCCRCCDQYGDGDGTQKCLSCKDIEKLLPSMETSRKKHVYMPYPPELTTHPDYDTKIDTFDSVDVLTPTQFAVLVDRGLKNYSWGAIAKIRCMNRINVKRTYNRAIRRLCGERLRLDDSKD